MDADRALVDEAKAGSLEAFDVLLRRYQVRVVNYVLALTRDPNEAEDLAQEAFVRAFRALKKFRGESSFKTWLYSIATNVAQTHLDGRGRRERLGERSADGNPLEVSEVSSGDASVEQTLVQREAIDRALAELSEDLRLAVILRDVEGLEYQEIADIMGVPLGTVESRIFRARQRLRPLLAPLVARAT